jgi:hypothetical protein
MATRMIGGFDKRDTCVETEAIRMSLCNARAMWVAAGSFTTAVAYRELARYSMVTSLPTAREDQVARRTPAKRGTIALRKHWAPRASGRLAQARLRQ